MTNNEDYRLEDAEDAAMKNSQMAKRVILGGAAAVAAGGAAYAAMPHPNPVDETLPGGEQAGAINEDVLDPAPQPKPAPAPEPEPQPEPEPESEVKFEDSTLVYDNETGEYVGGYDNGTIDGKKFTIVDGDGDGRADIMAYDENGNHIYEENEIQVINDDVDIPIGNGDNLNIAFTEPEPDYIDDTLPDNNYYDEHEDLANGNPDYQNNEEFAADTYDTVAPDENYLAEENTTDILPDGVDTVDFV